MEDPLSLTSPSQLRHALRTPLNHIIGYAEMILEDVRDSATATGTEASASALEAILFNARELVRFVQNAIDAEKPELSGREVKILQDWLRPHLLDLLGDIGILRDLKLPSSQDVDRIQTAAQRLLAFSNGKPEALDEKSPIAEELPPGPAPGERGRLLVVDDSPQNRDILRRSLERHGFSVAVAENGAAALALSEEGELDLILLDVLMPVMDGYTLLQRLKSSEQLKNVPVIMISALDESSAVVRCLQMGAEDYIMKPFDPVLVRTRVRAALDRSRALQTLSKVDAELSLLAARFPEMPAEARAGLQQLIRDVQSTLQDQEP